MQTGICAVVADVAPLFGLPFLPGFFRKSSNKQRSVIRPYFHGNRELRILQPFSFPVILGEELLVLWVIRCQRMKRPVGSLNTHPRVHTHTHTHLETQQHTHTDTIHTHIQFKHKKHTDWHVQQHPYLSHPSYCLNGRQPRTVWKVSKQKKAKCLTIASALIQQSPNPLSPGT